MSEPRPARTTRRRPRPLDAAVVGMACRFPGGPDLVAFWKTVLAGRDCTRDVPADRWDAGVLDDPDSADNDRVACRRGGYLDEPVSFDPTRYGVMPLAVDGGEAEQFLVLDAARAALEDAGLPGGVPADGRRVEVVIGRGNDFTRGNLTRLQHGRVVAQTLAVLRAVHPDWPDEAFEAVRADLKKSLPPFEAGTVAGRITNATAGRVADGLGLTGASYVVDAASASSLVALDLAARALAEGRADLAVVGGVYLQPDVDFPMVFSRPGARSRRGELRPFTASADGTVPGEGVGVVVVKRLADAERDGDRVYAVVKGVGLAGDGRGAGLAAPNAAGLARAIRRAYRVAGVDPATVDLVEGHGLGVPASDRAELKALAAIFPRPARGRRALGAVSSLIGHAMPAAGMAGLIKTALALHHRVLPASLGAGDPHPRLRRPDSAFALNPANRPWVHGVDAHPRRAGVNAFGFAGVNAHAVLEEHAASADRPGPGCMTGWETEAVLLGAADRGGLREVVDALAGWLEAGRNAEVPLKDLAATLNSGQGPFPCRLGLVVSSTADLRARLRSVAGRLADPACRSVRDAKGTYYFDEPLAAAGRVAFLFPGEGSQYPGMLADLCPHFPEVRAVLDVSDRLARDRNAPHLPSDLLFGEPAGGGDAGGLWDVETAVNVVLSSQWALYQLLTRLGVRPGAVVGHSSGEFLALAAAGVFVADRQLEDRLGDLGTVFGGLEVSGRLPSAALLAAAADRDRVEAVCRDLGVAAGVAIDNCPHQVVVAGEPGEVEAVAARLRDGGVLLERLPFSRAYHTPAFADALPPIRAFFDGLAMDPPTVPVYSCASASLAGPGVDSVRRLAVDQWVSPVRFRETVEAMHADGVRVFVEVGARGSLTGFVEDTLRGRPHFAVPANLPRRSGLTQLNHLAASLYAHGVSFRPEHLYARRRPARVDLARDFEPATPGPGLALGFPEMRLSEATAARLRALGRGHPGDDRPHAPDRNGTHPEPRNGREPARAANGKAAGNGHTPAGNGLVKTLDRFTRTTEAARDEGREEVRFTPRPSAPAAATAEEALLAYLKTMDAFLETQREVMEAYLGSRPPAPVSHDDAGLVSTPDVSAPAPPAHAAAAVSPPAPVEPPPPIAAPAGPGAVDVLAVLLDEVSRRTGYPREMLDPDYDMEGDLGIDSIKRVEILGEIQARGVVPAGTDTERLSRCRTLGQIVALLAPGPGAEPARWVGEVERHEPGRSLVAVRWLDVRDDPVAAHHTLGGRRVSAVDRGRLGYPVVPFTVMAEILAQAAAVLVPGKVVVELRDVQANRWLPYDPDEPVALEVRADRDPATPELVRVAVRNRGTRSGRKAGGDEPTVSGTVVFGDRRDPGPVAPAYRLADAGACRFTADELYRDQWLFHGPALQALARVGQSARGGIEGTLRVLPRRALLPERLWPTLHTDPIVLDAFTHLLGGWGLDKKAGEEGDVIFPLRLASLKIYGDDPPEGAAVECRVTVTEVTRHRVKADADLVGPDGRVWYAFRDWEDWRFYWPGRYRDVMRQPDTVFVGEPVPLPGLEGRAVAVWLEPPPDFVKPVWRDVLEWVQLSPAEYERAKAGDEPEAGRNTRLWGLVAAKEAARRLLAGRGEPPTFAADWEVTAGPDGTLQLRSRLEPGRDGLPALGVATAEGVAVAAAAVDPADRVGVGLEPVGGDGEWPARRTAAGRAAAWAAGPGAAVASVDEDEDAGLVTVRLADGRVARATTARRGDHAWAWAIIERTGP